MDRGIPFPSPAPRQPQKLRFTTSRSPLPWVRRPGNDILRNYPARITDLAAPLAATSLRFVAFTVSFDLRRQINVIGYAVLRNFATWAMIVGVFVAVSLRAVGFEHSQVKIQSSCCHTVETCSESDPGNSCPDGHQHDGEKCPQNHHHHKGCCSSAQPLTVENDHLRQPGIPGSSLLGVRHEGEVPPEGPFLGSEKPPLI